MHARIPAAICVHGIRLTPKRCLGIPNPRVALLNIGARGYQGRRAAEGRHPLLKQAAETGAINFTGNMEASDVPLGGADVIVADGFSGNILLKGIEGTAKFMASDDEAYVQAEPLTKLARCCAWTAGKALKRKMDYRERAVRRLSA